MNIQKLFLRELPFFLGIPAVIWQIFFVYLPLLVLFALSFSSFSFSHIASFFTVQYGAVLLRSLVLGLETAFFALIIGYPVAYWMALSSGRYKLLSLFLLFLPFLTNILLHIYAWMLLLSRTGFLNQYLMSFGGLTNPLEFLNSMGAVSLVMVYCYIPFMIFPIYSDLEKFDKRMLEASADLGASPFQTFWRVIFPLSLSGVRSGFFLVLVPSFSEFIIPELIGGDRMLFAGGVVAHFTMHGEKMVADGAAFTCLSAFLLISVVSVLYWLIDTRWWRTSIQEMSGTRLTGIEDSDELV